MSPSLDTVGPMARDIQVAAHMLQAMAGHDPADPATALAPKGPKPGPYEAGTALVRPVKGMQLAVLGDQAMDGVSDAVGDAYLSACAVLERQGARLVLAARDAEALTAAAVAAAGPIDVLFNCAGVVHGGSILEMKDSDLDFAIDLNVKAMIRTIRAVLPGISRPATGKPHSCQAAF